MLLPPAACAKILGTAVATGTVDVTVGGVTAAEETITGGGGDSLPVDQGGVERELGALTRTDKLVQRRHASNAPGSLGLKNDVSDF